MPVEPKQQQVSNFMDHEDKKGIPRRQSKPRKEAAPKLTAEQQAEVNRAIEAAMIQFDQQLETERTKQKYADLETIDHMLSEHVGPYILIGYNLNNEPIEIFSANNALESAALTEHFKKVFIERSIKHGTDLM